MKATVIGGDLNIIPDCVLRVPVRVETAIENIISGATSAGSPTTLVSTFKDIKFKILPEITDSKSVSFQDEPVIGRSFPIKTFSHSENRTISLRMHFVITNHSDAINNLGYLRLIQSASYPRTGTITRPYIPPPILQFKCGRLLSANYLCVVMKNYNVNFPTDVAWYEVPDNIRGQVAGAKINTYLPYKFTVDCSLDVVYPNESLPGQETILSDY